MPKLPKLGRRMKGPSLRRGPKLAAAAAAAMPFRNDEFGGRQPVRRQSDFTLSTQLPQLHSQPFVSVDWLPAPRVNARPSSDAPNLLLSTLAVPEVPTPFKQDDWSVPMRSSIRKEFEPQNLLLTTLGLLPPEPMPFNVFDWPVRQRVHTREDWEPQNRLAYFDYDFGMPFSQQDWAMRPRVHTRKDWETQNRLAYFNYDFSTPFSQLDWPVRARAMSPHLRRDVLDHNLLALLTAVVAPLIPGPSVDYQGDGKRRRKRRNRTYELFRDMEETIRLALAGEVAIEPTTTDHHVRAAAQVLDLSQGFDTALDQLLYTAGEYQDLSQRVATLRTEILAYEAAKRRQAILDDDEEWMMWL